MDNLIKYALVIGGTGNLGKSLVNQLKGHYKIVNFDRSQNLNADYNILTNQEEKPSQYIDRLEKDLQQISSNFDLIACVAGGFVANRIKDKNVFENYEIMKNTSVIPSLIAGHLSAKYLKKSGILVLTSAQKVIKETCDGMISYGVAKNAIHTINFNLAGDPEFQATVVTILPTTIDTPQNREAMPKEDFSKWIQPDSISGLIKMWADGSNKPKTGSLAILNWKNDCIVPEFI